MDMIDTLESYYVVYRKDKVIWDKNDEGFFVHTRSTSKLFQVLPLYSLGLKEKYGLTDEEMVLLSSSHFGIPEQVNALRSILAKTRLSIDKVQLPESVPRGRKAYLNWLASEKKKNKIYHPCIGNHLAVMLLEREMAGVVDGYLKVEGKAQQYLSEMMASVFDIPLDQLIVMPDYCGMTNYYVSADKLASAYGKYGVLTERNDWISNSAAIHRNNIMRFPDMLEGDGGLATIISGKKNMIGKTGTGGLLAISVGKGSLKWEEDCGIVLLSKDGQWDMVARDVERILTETL